MPLRFVRMILGILYQEYTRAYVLTYHVLPECAIFKKYLQNNFQYAKMDMPKEEQREESEPNANQTPKEKSTKMSW